MLRSPLQSPLTSACNVLPGEDTTTKWGLWVVWKLNLGVKITVNFKFVILSVKLSLSEKSIRKVRRPKLVGTP